MAMHVITLIVTSYPSYPVHIMIFDISRYCIEYSRAFMHCARATRGSCSCAAHSHKLTRRSTVVMKVQLVSHLPDGDFLFKVVV
jgi:hypothetical protein